MNERSGGDDRGKIITLDFDALAALEDDILCVRLHRRTRDMLLSISDYLTWRTRYIHGDGSNIRADETEVIADIKAWGAQAKNELMADDGECVNEDECVNYQLSAALFTYAPASPYDAPDYVPPGYSRPPFYTNSTTLPGILASDLMVDYLSVPVGANIIDLLMQGFPRVRINFSGVGQVEIEFVAIPNGGLAYVTTDGDPNGGDFVNLSSIGITDLIDLGAILDTILGGGLTQSHIIERFTDTPGDHYMDITFLPNVNANVIVGFGGGIRRVGLCAGTEPTNEEIMPEFRLNGEHLEWRGAAGVGDWIDLGDIVPKPIITAERIGSNVDIIFALETNPTATTVLATISDGAAGADGVNGADGLPGAPGDDGECPDCGADDPAVAARKCRVSFYVAGEYMQAARELLQQLTADAATLDLIDPTTFDASMAAYGLAWNSYNVDRAWLIDFVANWDVYTTPAPSNFDNWLSALRNYVDEETDNVQCALLAVIPDEGYISESVITAWHTLWETKVSAPNVRYNDFFRQLLLHTSRAALSTLVSLGQSYQGDYDCEACADDGLWCYTFDFTASDGGWAARGGTDATYSAGNGWSTISPQGAGRYCVIQRSFTAELVSIETEIDYVLGAGGGNPQTRHIIVREADGDPLFYNIQNPSSGSPRVDSWTGVQSVSNLEINVWTSNANGSGSAIVKRVTLRGNGTNPFGSDNCT